MPGSSYSGFWIYLDDDWLEPDYPVSAGYSWILRDSTAHLIDSQAQVRVSWMGKVGRNDHFVFAATYDGYYAVSFPVTVYTKDKLPGLSFRYWHYTGDAANTVTTSFKLVWDTGTPFDPALDALHSFSDTTTSTTGEAQSNFTITAKDATQSALGRRVYSIEENNDDHTTEMRMVRLEITQTDDSDEGGGLVGLQVIEYPLWT